MTELLSFQEALQETEGESRRHLLLGNGFSIAWNRDAFSYESLRSKADLAGLSCDGDQLFDALGTNDFEIVIDRLGSMEKLLEVYDPDSPLADDVNSDAAVLREALAQALAGAHPNNVGEIAADEYRACRRFLQHFSRVYSVNYDLLLYWSTLQDEIDELTVVADDGFRNDVDDEDADWVVWDNVGSRQSQTVHHLHGALHLFDAGDRLKKLTWIRTSVPLLDQIRTALDAGEYPLVVTEGRSEEKLQKIDHSAYLSGSYRSFGNIGGVLFVYGHSLAESDDHILELILRSKVTAAYISIFGEPDSPLNRRIQSRATQLADQRHIRTDGRKPLAVAFYDAASAEVWRPLGD
jgi:hypothetical protein